MPSPPPRGWRSRRRGIAALVASLTFAAVCGREGPPASRRPSALAAEEQPFCSELVSVGADGTHCGVNTRIAPWAPADADWGGATFQSDAGPGQSHDITITFDAPVAQVEITAYDLTYTGNAMYAYEQKGALVGSADFPGNGVPGKLTTQTRSISGSIAQVRLTAAPRDYVNYSMRVQYLGSTSRSSTPTG